MSTYIAFLRSVNVGKRRYPMAELRAALVDAGYDDPQTHIQTGNVRVTTPLRSRVKVEAALEKVFQDDRGFEVPTVVFTPAELRQVVEDADDVVAAREPEFGHYVELLRRAPSEAGRELIEAQDHPGQKAVVRGRAVHLLFDLAYHEAKGPPAEVRRALGVSTNRNVTVIRTLAQKWG